MKITATIIKTTISAMDDERPTSALDNLTRLSLLDVVLQRTASLNRKSLIHLVVIVGKLNPERRFPQDLAEHFERMFKSYSGHFQVEPLTGLLLIYPNHFLHIVEGPHGILDEVINVFSEKKGAAGDVSEVKLLVYSSDVPARLFSQWAYRILNISSVRMDESKMQDSIETKISEALLYINKLSKELSKIPKLQLKASFDQLSTKYSNLLLPQDIIECLLKSKDLPTLTDYVKMHKSSLDVTLQNELIWPIQDNLLF